MRICRLRWNFVRLEVRSASPEKKQAHGVEGVLNRREPEAGRGGSPAPAGLHTASALLRRTSQREPEKNQAPRGKLGANRRRLRLGDRSGTSLPDVSMLPRRPQSQSHRDTELLVQAPHGSEMRLSA